jgi:uncharacterized membrane protein YhdT
MGIALFYITSSCITYLSAIVLANFLMEDVQTNGDTDRYRPMNLTKIKGFLIPIFNIVLVIVMARMVYSYHQYTLGYTDYNIFEKEGELK